MDCTIHQHCTLQCSECRSYNCQDDSHRELPYLHRRDWLAIAQRLNATADSADDMPDDREAYYNERAERMP